MKRLISVLLSVAMFLTLFVAAVPASAAETALGNDTQSAAAVATVSANHVPADFDGDGKTDAGAIAINSVAGLQGIAGGGKYYLTKDIVVTTGQNGVTAGKPVKGWTGDDGFYFDGCGFTVKMNENAGTADTATSLFDGCKVGTTYVKNLNVTGIINAPASHNQHISALGQGGGGVAMENVVSDVDITVKSFNGNLAVGGVWSKTEGKACSFKNVHFTGSITMKCPIPTAGYGGVGGIVGYAKCDLTLENCSNSGNITVGVAGMTVPTGNANVGIGGIVGKLDGAGSKTATIKRCENSGNLEAIEINNACVGGIVGFSNQMNLVIGACKNSGTIKGANNATTAGSSNIHAGFGGILGSANNNSTTCKVDINGCSNSGKITTNSNAVNNVYAGGIVGRFIAVANVSVVSCSNTADIDISKGDRWSSAGGIIGTVMTICEGYSWSKISSSTITVDKCQNSGKISSGIWAAGILASGIQLHEDDIVIKISYCLNTAEGEIKAGLDSTLEYENRAVAGGIAGMMGEEVPGAQEQFGRLAFEYCVNRAPVTAGASARAAGGILGCTDGDSLVGVTSSGTDSKQANQETFYGVTCDMYSQKTWFDYCGNDGSITCQNASGKVAAIAGSIANKYYLWNSQACGTRTLGTANATTNAWVVDTWVAQTGNDMSLGKLETLAAEVQTAISGSIVDTAALEAAIAEAKALQSGNYTPDSWSILQMVLADAEAALSAKNQADIDAATGSLKDAIAALEGGDGEVDYTALEEAIDQANSYNEDEYTVESWNAVITALEAASEALDSSSQSDVDSATSALKTALNNLEKPDYEGLLVIIAEAEEANESDYSPENWALLQEAIADATATLESRSQVEIEDALVALAYAIEATLDAEGDIGDPGDEGDPDNSGETEDGEDSTGDGDIADDGEDTEDDADMNDEGNTDSGNNDNGNADNGGNNTDSDSTVGENTDVNTDGNTDTNENTDGESDTADSESASEGDKSTNGKKKKGCKSAIAASAVVLTTVFALGLGFKKKED